MGSRWGIPPNSERNGIKKTICNPSQLLFWHKTRSKSVVTRCGENQVFTVLNSRPLYRHRAEKFLNFFHAPDAVKQDLLFIRIRFARVLKRLSGRTTHKRGNTESQNSVFHFRRSLHQELYFPRQHSSAYGKFDDYIFLEEMLSRDRLFGKSSRSFHMERILLTSPSFENRPPAA